VIIYRVIALNVPYWRAVDLNTKLRKALDGGDLTLKLLVCDNVN
jgi:hypothetical protein